MKVLLVEPDYRRASKSFRAKQGGRPQGAKRLDDDSLWYPPLGLMKIATFHKRRGDEVKFVSGCDTSSLGDGPLFGELWDRVYISTLFTFDWENVLKTIDFYKVAVGGSTHKIFVGGIMASLMPEDLFEETGIYPVCGILNSPQQINLAGSEDIDLMVPDYQVLVDGADGLYGINDTYYGYTTRGCTQKCPWCGVPDIEPIYKDYIDIKPYIIELRSKEPAQIYGDKAKLKLMDNNILASPHLEKIVNDLLYLGYGRGKTTETIPPKMRSIDFNQGLDATHFTEDKISLLSRLNIRPMRVAFDRIHEKDVYMRALEIAYKYGFREFSNYMLYNWKDSPRDLYERLLINIKLNERWGSLNDGEKADIYSYPMRFAPIRERDNHTSNKERDAFPHQDHIPEDLLNGAVWNKRFARNIEIIKGANHGSIPPKPSYALRAIGCTYEEYITNLYMPEELLRNRNKYEFKVYDDEPNRPNGSGEIERFREWVLDNIYMKTEIFIEFHKLVSRNSKAAIRKGLMSWKDQRSRTWLEYYLTSQ